MTFHLTDWGRNYLLTYFHFFKPENLRKNCTPSVVLSLDDSSPKSMQKKKEWTYIYFFSVWVSCNIFSFLVLIRQILQRKEKRKLKVFDLIWQRKTLLNLTSHSRGRKQQSNGSVCLKIKPTTDSWNIYHIKIYYQEHKINVKYMGYCMTDIKKNVSIIRIWIFH